MVYYSTSTVVSSTMVLCTTKVVTNPGHLTCCALRSLQVEVGPRQFTIGIAYDRVIHEREHFTCLLSLLDLMFVNYIFNIKILLKTMYIILWSKKD